MSEVEKTNGSEDALYVPLQISDDETQQHVEIGKMLVEVVEKQDGHHKTVPLGRKFFGKAPADFAEKEYSFGWKHLVKVQREKNPKTDVYTRQLEDKAGFWKFLYKHAIVDNGRAERPIIAQRSHFRFTSGGVPTDHRMVEYSMPDDRDSPLALCVVYKQKPKQRVTKDDMMKWQKSVQESKKAGRLVGRLQQQVADNQLLELATKAQAEKLKAKREQSEKQLIEASDHYKKVYVDPASGPTSVSERRASSSVETVTVSEPGATDLSEPTETEALISVKTVTAYPTEPAADPAEPRTSSSVETVTVSEPGATDLSEPEDLISVASSLLGPAEPVPATSSGVVSAVNDEGTKHGVSSNVDLNVACKFLGKKMEVKKKQVKKLPTKQLALKGQQSEVAVKKGVPCAILENAEEHEDG